MFLLTILMIGLVVVLSIVLNGGGMELAYFLDLPSLLLIVLIVIPTLIGGGVWKDIKSAFHMVLFRKWDVTMNELKNAEHGIQVLMRTIGAAGLFESVCSLMFVLKSFGTEESAMEFWKVCAHLEVVMIPVFYSLVLLLALQPVKALIKRHIINFMGHDL